MKNKLKQVEEKFVRSPREQICVLEVSGGTFSLWLARCWATWIGTEDVFVLHGEKQSNAHGILPAAGEPCYYGMIGLERGILRRFCFIHFLCPSVTRGSLGQRHHYDGVQTLHFPFFPMTWCFFPTSPKFMAAQCVVPASFISLPRHTWLPSDILPQ